MRRQVNKIRTDTLEAKIAHYRALGNHEAAEAIEKLALQIEAPIDEDAIARDTEARRRVYGDIG